jgi:dihydroorotate dehydrogenase (NAD+) catalytic subunit
VTPDLSVRLGRLELKNPVLTASGTFGYGREFAPFLDLSRLGAVTVKGLSAEPWPGNPPPRVAETPAGLLNAIGLENPGIEHFLTEDLPWLARFDTKVVVNVVGKTEDEFCRVAERASRPEVAAIELNVSCPNVEGGLEWGQDPDRLHRLVGRVRQATGHPLIVKLSPNVADMRPLAQAAVAGGAEILSLINSVLGLALDATRGRPRLATVTGGLSGPAVKPIALRFVWEVSQAVPVPVVGMGGIRSGGDALEFLLAGASAVAVGTANFVRPDAALVVLTELEALLAARGVARLADVVGAAQRSGWPS